MPKWVAEAKAKKKKEQETAQKKAQSPSVTKAKNVTKNSTFLGGGAAVKKVEQQRTKTFTPKRQTTTPKRTTMTDAQYQKTYGQPRNTTTRTDTSRTSTVKKQPTAKTNSTRLTEAQRQKMGFNNMATPETRTAVDRAIKNTPGLVKKAVLDTVQGHGQTLADITEMTASSKTGAKAKAMKMGIDPEKDKAQMAEVERERQRTAEAARLDREKWAKEQDERQKAWDKKVNGAGGLEKAYYGAVESGTGMLTDLAIGLGTQGGSLAAMFSRTYGTTRGQAEKEGATEGEDRTYAFLQAAKEVGTELMFPGVGLAKGYAKKTGLPMAERVANNLTKRIANRTAADLTGAGVRLIGGTAEENLEEVAGFGLDPLIKEFSYGRNVRTRQKIADLQNESDELRANIQSDEDARRVASYLSSSEWLEQNKAQYKEAGLNDKDAQEVAEMMRDYMTASLTGDTETMDMLEQEIAGTLSKGEFSYRKSLDKSELLDTLASTTLLTMTTGLPGTASTTMRGSVIRDNLGEEGIRTLAESAMNYEDEEASKRGEVARDRLNAGQELTASQVYELAASQAQQVEKDTQRVVAKNNVVADTLESEKLVAPMIMRDEKGNIHGDAVITQRYNESAQEAENVLKDLDKEQKLSLSDSELAVGSRAIAGFQTGAFTINDANALNYTNTAVRDAFEKVTGVDLGQYVVKTSSGAVDYAATNAATKDALFTMAADNFIETARAETENFKDITKGITAEQMAARVGSNGDMAISTALDTVDPADEDTYGLMASAAQNVYEYGRYTEDSWDDVSGRLSEMYPGLSQEALQDVYEAAKRDKTIAETPYYNAKVTAGESTSEMDMSEANQAEYGKFTNETGEDIGMKERAVLESIASEFNINIRLLPSEFFEYKYTDRNGKEKTAYSNGTYDPKTGTMLLNGGNDMERNIIAVALHELTHHIAIYAPTEYLALSNRVMEAWYKNDADAFNAAIQRKQENYKAQVKQNLSEEQALEEVIADAMGEMASDPDFISQICTEEPTLAEQIINAIKSILRKLRAIMASGNVSEEHEDAFFNQLGIWDDAQRLWMQAAKVAQQQRANQAIDDWDAQERYSVGYHAGDLGKSRNDDYWGQGYGRGTGHFGFGTYFVGNQDRIRNYNNRNGEQSPVEEVDFDKYNLFRPSNFDKGLALHDALKVVDGFITEYSELANLDILNEKDAAKINLMSHGIQRSLENYLWDEEDLKAKKVVDDFIDAMPERYQDDLDRKARQAYNDAQQRSVEEADVRTYLSHMYDLVHRYSDETEEEYIERRLAREIESRNEEKKTPVEEWKYRYAEDVIKEYTDAWDFKRSKLSRLDRDLVNALNYQHSSEKIKKALIETERIVKNYPSKDVRGLDSPATVFMKQLGYEGVDVRHINELDNVQFGSVIYDLKDDDLSRKQEIGTAKYSLNEPKEDNEGAVLTEDQQRFYANVAPELRDDNGNIKRYFHGTARADRVGYYFNPERATSGPMAYFTDSRDIATNYSRDKADTSLAYEGEDINDYHNQFVVDVDGEEVRLEDYWHHLPAKKRLEYRERAGHITYDYDGEDDSVLVINENVSNGNGGYGADPYLVRNAHGNAFRMLIDAWLDSGDFFNEEERFLEVMDLLGMEGVRYKDPNYRDEKVYEVYLNVTNPIVTTNLDEEFAADVEDWLDATDLDYYARESASADMWDKNDRDPYDWLDSLRDDIENGTTHVWTSIPDVITDFLKEQGYDGIVDQGGKYHEAGHQVVIPFEPNQIKLTTNEHPTEDVDIRYSIDDSRVMYTPYGVEVVQNPTDSEYRDMRNAFFDKYPWLRGTGEPPLRRTFDEEGNVYYWESSTMHSGVEPFINMRYNTRTAQQDGWWKGSDKDDWPRDYSSVMARYSIQEELDEPYMDAVNSGNMEEAQRLVDEAARKAGMRVAHRYHGTMNAGFTVFDKAYAKVGGNSGAGFYFSTEEDDSVNHYQDVEGADNYFKWSSLAEHINQQIEDGEWEGPELETYEDVEEYAKNQLNANPGTYDVYLNYKNPYVRNGRQSTNIFNKLDGSFDDSVIDRDDYESEDDYDDAWRDAYYEHIQEEVYGAVYGAYIDIEDFYEVIDAPMVSDVADRIFVHAIEYESLDWDDILDAVSRSGYVTVIRDGWTQEGEGETEFTRAIIENFGYDAIEDKEVSSKFGQLSREMMTDTEHIIVFKPEQIKLSDPVTYAEDGSIIPLSERFDPNNDDIRYSLPAEDSDGNLLSDGQMEFFKNSQARDTLGRLIPMYHVTPIGGFTIFNPAYSFDETSLSFSNDMDFALNYSSEDGNPDDWRTAAETRLGDEETEDGVLGHYKVYLNMENPLILEGDYLDEMDIYEWPVYAKTNGYDGVIYREFEEEADIYQVFSSNQIKDTRNTDPTNNPDIRYSITDDEEAQSKMAYDDALDTSYEALAYYESMISDIDEDDDGFINHPMQVYLESLQKYGESDEKARNAKNKYKYRPTATIDNEEELINEFYAGLNSYTEYFVFDDPILEEGRKRMARSRSDFMERLNAEWDDRWLTEGEILDVNSVKKDVREMVKSIMRNADTPNKVKNDIVKKTLIDIRLAYQFAKKGRIDVADALLWHTSMRMIEGVEFVNDDTFNEYKDLREYLRTTRIQLGEEYWADVDYQAFRKNNFGRMKLVKGQTNVDEIYQEMCERWPEWFSEEEEMTPPDQLLQIEHVLDVIQPYKEAYSSEEAASIATDIAYDLSNIVYGKGRPYESLADKYKNRYDKQTQAMRQRHQEALNKVREQRDKGIKAERAKWQVREQKRKERQAHSKAFDSIVKNYKWLSERLLTNTKDKHIPEQYKKELAGLLAAFDLQTVGSKKVEARRGQKGQKTIKMEAMKKAINNIEAKSEFFHVNDSITDIIDELLGRDSDGAYKKELSIEGKTIDELSVDELIKIDKLLKSLKHEFIYYETVRTGAKRTQAADIGTAQVDSSLKHAELFGPGKDYNNITGALDKILNMDEMTPAYVFKRIDPNNTGIGMMFKELRRSFDKYVKNQEQLNKWMEEILSPYHSGGKLWKKYGAEEIEDWRRAKATNTFKLQSGDEIRLTPAQMMSVYCLAKRPQAYQHMVGAGIVIKPVTYQAKLETDFKRKTNWALPTILSDGDIKMISTALTPEQKQVADQLQKLMATKMAAWGNEASRAVIGIDLFEDPDYFPIQSDRAALEEDFTADQFVDMIRNFGFTKAVQPGAKNAIAIDDIFTVVSTHCNNMNLYNAYSESMNDFMKVYNYHALREDGSDYSVKQAIAHAYSQKATTFISTFMRDLNGNVSKGRVTGIDNMMNAALGNAKKASVFANGRVALQQPTAIMRAFAVISPKYLKGVNLLDVVKGITPKVKKEAMEEMFQHCPIALWKSWGYYDINMGKSIEDIMMNNGNWLEDKMTDIYGAADNVTWTAIWQMCKAEVKDKNPKVKEGSDEFWDLVNERMTEVVDLTQVVDSPFHRSHAMRDKQILVKMATSFMAEPTLTFNMVRDGLVNSYEMYKLGDKVGAAKLLGKTTRVFTLSAFATAAAAAIWDAVRGKQPDGDDDEEGNAFDLWWANTIANFQDNLKLWNNIYYIKDIASLFDGWGTSNLALQGWKQLADGYAQLTGAYRVNSKKAWWENMLAGIGYLSGTPFGTILKDGRALLNILGIHPSFLSAIGEDLDAVQDMLGGSSAGSGVGHTSSNNKSNNKKAGSDEADATSAAVKLWTYDNAPIKVEDGSAVDKFLNRFGVNLTASEILAAEAQIAEKEYQQKVDKITSSLSEYSGEEYDKHLWDKSDLEGYGKAIEEGDFERAEEIEKLFVDCGGSQEFIDEKKLYHYNRNYVKSIVYNPTDEQIEQQQEMKDFLLSHGMSEAELSEKVYKSQTRKELQVAFRINDEDAIVEELTPLIRAGLSYDDFVKAYENRNRIDIKKYKDSDGKYAERLKSTGIYNWPVTGSITSNFGHRASPGGIGSTNHMGLDIGADMGTPVAAADGGTVVYAGWDGGYGKCVRIEHDDGTITEYAHLSWWDAEVGDTVAQGQTIGNVGSTGNSTGPHLHFGVKVNGSYVDPLTKLN